MKDFGSSEDWDTLPELDPAALAHSQSIDAWLEDEHQKSVREKCSLVLLSPPGERQEELRLRAFKLLSPELTLGATTCSVATFAHKNLKKKLLVDIRPHLVLYLVDCQGAGDVKDALKSFFSACRGFALDDKSAIAVVVQHKGDLHDIGKEEWTSILPSFGKTHHGLMAALEEEFQQAGLAATGGQVKHIVVSSFLGEQSSPVLFREQIAQAHRLLVGGQDDDDDDEEGFFEIPSTSPAPPPQPWAVYAALFWLALAVALGVALVFLGKGGEEERG
ncbi:hypothetical protein BASA82_000554 [Batrachochytrium salamandrivorans]|nr:hypothetical protein BASA81_003744 [Batrachochytrium salamandrivorans]KAH9262399.1 hypothetical protein BASA82_000554 [Batrachochytrium salamandrivorans]